MNPHETDQKITPDQRARKAVVYLRQSSLQQVKQNKQSQRLQYALVDRAKAFGFDRKFSSMRSCLAIVTHC